MRCLVRRSQALRSARDALLAGFEPSTPERHCSAVVAPPPPDWCKKSPNHIKMAPSKTARARP
eukprot:803941-Prymnesium_polylepis.1